MRCNLNGGVRPTGQSAVTNALVSLAVTNRPKLQQISAIAYRYIVFPFSIGRYLPGVSISFAKGTCSYALRFKERIKRLIEIRRNSKIVIRANLSSLSSYAVSKLVAVSLEKIRFHFRTSYAILRGYLISRY